jgi:hypothetical protein
MPCILYDLLYTGHTQNNGAVLIVSTIKPAPFFCVCPVFCTIYYIQSIHKRMVRCGGYLCVNRTILLFMPCIYGH